MLVAVCAAWCVCVCVWCVCMRLHVPAREHAAGVRALQCLALCLLLRV